MKARRRGITAACLLIGAAAAFAFWPLRARPLTVPVIERGESAKRTLAALDLAAFRAPIWVAEPPPPPPPAAAPPIPPPPPLKVQLLAIIREDGPLPTYRAAVYDPDTDRILVVAAGEKLGLRTVERVDRSSLTLRDEHGTGVLALKEGGAP